MYKHKEEYNAIESAIPDWAVRSNRWSTGLFAIFMFVIAMLILFGVFSDYIPLEGVHEAEVVEI